MLRTFTFLSAAFLLLTMACKKGNPVEEQSFGLLELELIQLPGTPALQVYMESSMLKDSLVAGPAGSYKAQILAADKKTKVTFRKKGSNEVLLDTNVLVKSGEKMNLRLAFSEDLGIKSFLKGKSGFGNDSASFQLFNKLPTAIQSNTLKVDVVLYKLNNTTGEFDELTVFENYQRLKLHPKVVIVPMKDSDQMDITYFIRYKNADTGEFILDTSGNDLAVLGFTAGKEHIISTTADELDLGGGTVMYFYSVQPIEL
ncbi:hypothetical protein AAHN97_02435 [Chitinophaga niabensis]|uniref:hypothetical protein n=1 Tax=Chitinophaga niabensis TaxID=536979 RepID=UPI0031BA49A7